MADKETKSTKEKAFKIRNLTADEIECRVASVGKKQNGVSLLLYKDARCDMNILDETFGAENWQRRHYECKGNLFCEIGVKCGSEWVWKGDCGSESNAEKEKGEASDSFKRAGFNWGIGRELYTAPFIWVGSDKCNIEGNKCNDKFEVKDITIKDKKIVGLTIYNATKNMVCYSLGAKTTAKQEPVKEKSVEKPKAKQEPKATAEDVKRLQGVMAETGYTIEDVQKVYGVTSLFDLTKDKLNNAMERMQAKTKKPAKADRRTQEELLDLQALMADTNVSIADIMKEYKVERLDELSKEQYQDATERLTAKLIAGDDVKRMIV